MHAIKDRNGMDLIEAEEIRRGGKNLQNNYTKMVLVTWHWPQDWKTSIFTHLKKGSPKECSNYWTITLSHMLEMSCLKSFNLRLRNMWTDNFPDVQAGFRKGRGSRGQIANIHRIIEKQENSSKKSTSASLTTLKLLTVWITTNCGKFLKRWIQFHFMHILWHLYAVQEAAVRPRDGTTDWFKIGKGRCLAPYCHPAYLI